MAIDRRIRILLMGCLILAVWYGERVRGFLFWLLNAESALFNTQGTTEGICQGLRMVKKNFLSSPPYPFDQKCGRCGPVDCYNHHIPRFKAAATMCFWTFYICPHCICHSLYDHFILCIKAGCAASVPVLWQNSSECLWMSGRGNKAQQFTLVFSLLVVFFFLYSHRPYHCRIEKLFLL